MAIIDSLPVRSGEVRDESIDHLSRVVCYEDYRQMCDEENPAFRKVGILLPDAYEAAIRDKKTIFIIDENGKEVPLLVPVDYAVGYDPDRTKKLAEDEGTLFLSMRVDKLTAAQAEVVIEAARENSVLIESKEEMTPDLQEAFAACGLGIGEFIDVDMRTPENYCRLASMLAFSSLSYPDVEDTEVREIHTSADIEQIAMAIKEKHSDRWNGGDRGDSRTDVLSSASLAASEGLLDKLWAISSSRFSEMAAYHPVSAEEDKDFFKALLFDSGTATVVRYDEGEPVAFGTLMLGVDHCFWLSEEFRNNLQAGSDAFSEVLVYFPEIVASRTGKTALGYSKDIMGISYEVFAEAKRRTNFIFECTNRSATYIPKLVKIHIQPIEGIHMPREVLSLGGMRYWYIKK